MTFVKLRRLAWPCATVAKRLSAQRWYATADLEFHLIAMVVRSDAPLS